ncbi:hypothetical protein [Streptomyces capparidis]
MNAAARMLLIDPSDADASAVLKRTSRTLHELALASAPNREPVLPLPHSSHSPAVALKPVPAAPTLSQP